MSKRKITLIGDIHKDNSHMPRVIEYINKKLQKDNRALLALEELDNENLPMILRNTLPEQNTSQRPFRNATKKKTEVDKINDLELLNSGTQETYKDFFQKLLKEIGSNKQDSRELYIDQVDNNAGVSNEYDAKRDVNMRDKIIDLMKVKELNRAIYPVGSAHIFNKGSKGNRLATLIRNDSGNNLKLKNFYTPNTESYNEVQKSIDDFYKLPKNKQPLNAPEMLGKKSYNEAFLNNKIEQPPFKKPDLGFSQPQKNPFREDLIKSEGYPRNFEIPFLINREPTNNQSANLYQQDNYNSNQGGNLNQNQFWNNLQQMGQQTNYPFSQNQTKPNARGGHIKTNRHSTIDLERIAQLLAIMSRGMNV
jgi:hypothetical protein